MVATTMSGKERCITTVRGGKPDKLPLYASSYSNFITNYYGISVAQCLNEPQTTAKLMVEFVEEFGLDRFNPAVGYIVLGCGPELGVKWEWVGENFPAAVEGSIKSMADVEKVQVPTEPTGYFKTYLETIRLVNETIGDRVFVTASILGPFSTACFLRGIEGVMLDTQVDMPLFEKYMTRCVELSRYFGKHLFTILQTPQLNEIFLIPELVSPRFYHQYIAPYDNAVCQYFNVPNSIAAVMGRPDDEVSQREGRYVWEMFFGTKESLEVIEKGLKYKVPGLPVFVSVSGRMLVTWSKDEILDFVKRGVELVRGHDLYPAISLMSMDPPSPESALDVADKMRSIRRFRDSYEV